MIDRKTQEAVQSDEFASIDRSLLEAVVKRDTLTIKEVELFSAVDLWATKECERQGFAIDGKIKRRILGDEIVKGIRFPSMEETEFVYTVLESKILKQDEISDLMNIFEGGLNALGDFMMEWGDALTPLSFGWTRISCSRGFSSLVVEVLVLLFL